GEARRAKRPGQRNRADGRRMMAEPKDHSGARVDYLVDENASAVDVPDNSRVEVAADDQPTVGATGPTNWWRMGLIALGIVALILLRLQLLGGAASTEVIPDRPTSAPVEPPPPGCLPAREEKKGLRNADPSGMCGPDHPLMGDSWSASRRF